MVFNDINVGERAKDFVSEAHKGEIHSGPFPGPTQNKANFFC